MVSKNQLERLAEADNLGTVMKVEEIFQDYLIVNEYLFSFEMAPNQLFSSNYIWNEARLTNCTSYLVSLLLFLSIRPEIGYDTGSKVCRKLAQSLKREIERNERALCISNERFFAVTHHIGQKRRSVHASAATMDLPIDDQ